MGCCSNRSLEGEDKIIYRTSKNIKSKYDLESKILGAGRWGNVFKASLISNPSHEVAVKVINKVIAKNNSVDIYKQVDMLSKLDHPNIAKYYETFENRNYYYVIMELWVGGDLFDVMQQKSLENQWFTEAQAAVIIYDLIKAINYCHNNKVMHLDIRPENILIGDNGDLKLIDFRTVEAEDIHEENQTKHTWPWYYSAPEVLEGDGNYKSDIWSLGVIFYILISGMLPFEYDKDVNLLIEKIKIGEYSMEHKKWDTVTEDAKDLISHMMCVDYSERYTAAQCFEHNWFQSAKMKVKDNSNIDKELLKSLMNFKASSKLKKASLNIIAKRLNTSNIK